MDATTYTSNGGVQTVTNNDLGTVGFKPDFLWFKNRSITQNNYLVDSNRGVANILVSNATTAENNAPTVVTSFNTNGFSFGVDNTANGNSMVGWQWVAGQGVNNTNTVGSTTSTVSSNTTTGFSIVTYTGTGTTATIGHGLNVAPQFIIVKDRVSSAYTWVVYHASLGATKYLNLNIVDAAYTSSDPWNNTSPTSTVFTTGISNGTNKSGDTYVAYCWAPVAGFSQFGSYAGNNSSDGPFIYTGFRPKFIMIKNYAGASGQDWLIWDTSRSPYNVEQARLKPNDSAAEVSGDGYDYVDALSNGFKLRGQAGSNGTNGSGYSYIYAAFAENPFKYANAR
jgi:hypothetical protein